ncbi:glycogen synthase GlgA [Hydrogenimonas sp.]
MRLLFAAAEMFPFAKTGGLGDIAHALPKALAQKAQVTAVMPLYRFIDRERYGIKPLGESFFVEMGENAYTVELFGAMFEGVSHLFVYEESLCERNYPYGPPGEGYADNDVRFAIFCHAVVRAAERLEAEVVHLNDWHTALVPLLLHDAGSRAKTVYTIHNLAYQGIFPYASLSRTGVAARHFTMEELEFYSQVNWMKGGIAHADAVTTVSPSYALEIQRVEYGCGLEGFLRKHAGKLRGILNGIDPKFFDPAADPALPARYDAKRLANKARCKKAFLQEVGLKDPSRPLFIFIGRFVEQKGIDLLAHAAPKLAKMGLNLAILGEGEERFHAQLEAVADLYDTIHLRFGYDEALSHRMYAAADFLLMPSRFEPCGLNQMIAMRYGAVPVAHAVGGLRDTVHDFRGEKVCGLGVSFEEPSAEALSEAVERAVALYAKKRRYSEVRRFDMGCDFTIGRCAEKYLALYEELL